MDSYISCLHLIFLIILASAPIITEQKKYRKNEENDILEKSEVTLKIPTYAIKMPPIITSRKRTGTKVDPLPVSCSSSNVTKSLSDLRKKIKCIPRDTVVEIAAPDGFTIVVPNTVVVKRCGGMCSGNKKCIAKKKTNMDFYVRTTQQKSIMVFCSRVTVPEDTECECGCNKKKKCSVDQKFDSSLCKCICTNKEEHQECLNKADLNFKWSAKNCSCVCRGEKLCTTGTVWSPKKCKCVKL